MPSSTYFTGLRAAQQKRCAALGAGPGVVSEAVGAVVTEDDVVEQGDAEEVTGFLRLDTIPHDRKPILYQLTTIRIVRDYQDAWWVSR